MDKERRLQKEAYKRYQYDWLIQHGYSLEDVLEIVESFVNDMIDNGIYDAKYELASMLEENGLGGELYVCFNEFLGAEFNDARYMYRILDEKLSKIYQAFKIKELIQTEIAEHGESYAPHYAYRVPGELLLPNQFCMNWSIGTTFAEMLEEMDNYIADFTF